MGSLLAPLCPLGLEPIELRMLVYFSFPLSVPSDLTGGIEFSLKVDLREMMVVREFVGRTYRRGQNQQDIMEGSERRSSVQGSSVHAKERAFFASGITAMGHSVPDGATRGGQGALQEAGR